MKKIYTLLLSACLGLAGMAQSQPERVVVYEKSGNHHSFLPERIDSIGFPLVEGEVAAKAELLQVTYNGVKLKVTRTPACVGFQLCNIPAVLADAMTDDAVLAEYVVQNSENTYFQDFPEADLIDETIQPNTNYVLVTLGLDQYQTPCQVQRLSYKTEMKPLIGNPKVTMTVDDVTPRSFTLSFEKNEDVKGYAALAGEKGLLQQQFEQMGGFMGFNSFSDMVKAWGVIDKPSFVWTDMEPNTEYEVFVQAWDKEDTYAPCDTFLVTTERLGDSGDAAVDVTQGEYVYMDWNGTVLPSQFITYTPNSHTACYRINAVLESEYEKDPEGYKNELPQEPPFPMSGWFLYEPVTTDYQIDPGVKFVILTVGRNADGVWGEVQARHFETPTQVGGDPDVAGIGVLSKMQNIGKREIQPKKLYWAPGQMPLFNPASSTRKISLKSYE